MDINEVTMIAAEVKKIVDLLDAAVWYGNEAEALQHLSALRMRLIRANKAVRGERYALVSKDAWEGDRVQLEDATAEDVVKYLREEYDSTHLTVEDIARLAPAFEYVEYELALRLDDNLY